MSDSLPRNSNSLKVGASQFGFFVVHFVKPGIFLGIFGKNLIWCWKMRDCWRNAPTHLIIRTLNLLVLSLNEKNVSKIKTEAFVFHNLFLYWYQFDQKIGLWASSTTSVLWQSENYYIYVMTGSKFSQSRIESW